MHTCTAQGIIDSERETVMHTLRECQARDSAVTEKEVQLESEVLRLTERLKEETATVNALKRQLLQFSDIAEKYKTILKEGEYEPGMQQVLDKVHNLFATQTNPLGEQYAVQKVLSQYNPQLRAVFLYYAQLEDNFTQHWPPSLAFQQFMLFCKVGRAPACTHARACGMWACGRVLVCGRGGVGLACRVHNLCWRVGGGVAGSACCGVLIE